MGKLINANKEEFDNVMSSEEGIVIVDFWAEWCGPCRMIGPTLQDISEETDATVIKVNVDENAELGAQYGIRNIPTILFFKGGEQVDKVVGAQPKAKFMEIIEKYSDVEEVEETEDNESED